MHNNFDVKYINHLLEKEQTRELVEYLADLYTTEDFEINEVTNDLVCEIQESNISDKQKKEKIRLLQTAQNYLISCHFSKNAFIDSYKLIYLTLIKSKYSSVYEKHIINAINKILSCSFPKEYESFRENVIIRNHNFYLIDNEINFNELFKDV